MLASNQISRHRLRRSSGNTLIEMAFTLIPTIAILVAFVDFGLVLFRWSTLQNAVREGARYAITFQRDAAHSLGQTASIQQVVEKKSMGSVHRTDSPQHIFVCYATTVAPNTCIPSGGNVPGNIVEVSVKNVTWSWLAPLSGSYSSAVAPFFRSRSPFNLNVYSADILGGYPVGVNSVVE